MIKHYTNKSYPDLMDIAISHAEKYQNALPFPNITFDNFFDAKVLNDILQEFPDLASIKNVEKFNNPREIKLAGKGEKYFGQETKKFMHFLNSEPFLNFLQKLTGIKEPLIGDPYFVGGGQHEIKKGGLLKVHADFNKHYELDLDRRINVLVYLNKDWKEEYGGHFELWNKEMTKCEKAILPTFNTLAIFSTTSYSYHGHPDPLNCPANRSRKSLALYYYTNGRPEEEINNELGKHSTLFIERKGNEDDKKAFSGLNKTKKHVKYSVTDFFKDITPPIIVKSLKKLK